VNHGYECSDCDCDYTTAAADEDDTEDHGDGPPPVVVDKVMLPPSNYQMWIRYPLSLSVRGLWYDGD